MAVASPYIKATAKEAKPFIKKGQIIVNVSKGLKNQLKNFIKLLEIYCLKRM